MSLIQVIDSNLAFVSPHTRRLHGLSPFCHRPGLCPRLVHHCCKTSTVDAAASCQQKWILCLTRKPFAVRCACSNFLLANSVWRDPARRHTRLLVRSTGISWMIPLLLFLLLYVYFHKKKHTHNSILNTS
jgi:hypothetical protein